MQQQAALRTSGLLVAEMGSAFAGFLLFSRTASSGLIAKLAVCAHFRRCGVGSALLRHGIAELERPQRRGATVSEILLHVDPAREEARQLYEAHGFNRAALLPGYYTDAPGSTRAALLMRRLNPESHQQQAESAPMIKAKRRREELDEHAGLGRTSLGVA